MLSLGCAALRCAALRCLPAVRTFPRDVGCCEALEGECARAAVKLPIPQRRRERLEQRTLARSGSVKLRRSGGQRGDELGDLSGGYSWYSGYSAGP